MTPTRTLRAPISLQMALTILLGTLPGTLRAQQHPLAERVPAPAPLLGTQWALAEFSGIRIAQDGRQPLFELQAIERYEHGSAGRLEKATDDCGNILHGIYRASGEWLQMRVTSSTLLACKVTEQMPPNLSSVFTGDHQFRILGNELDLLDSDGGVRARFVATRSE
jgi:hypothetical protein